MHPLHGRIRAHACVEGHSHAHDILVGTFMGDELMDASGALRTLDGGTGGRVLSFSRAETSRPTVNRGGWGVCGASRESGCGLGAVVMAVCIIRAH